MKEVASFFPVAYRALLSLNARRQAAGTEHHLPVILSSVESHQTSKMLSSLGLTSLLETLSLTLAKKGEYCSPMKDRALELLREGHSLAAEMSFSDH